MRRLMLALAALVLAPPLLAGQATKKYDFAPANGVQEVAVEAGKVKINQVIFRLDSRGTGFVFSTKAGDSGAKIRIDNNGDTDVEVGVAIVVFDAEGNIVGAGGGGTKAGYLKKGSRDTHGVDFDYVYRNADKAKSFIITLETKARAEEKK